MKKLIIITLICLCTYTATACGVDNSEQILAFQNNLNTVVLKMEQLDTELNDLDVSASDAVETALNALNELNTAFETLADIKVSDENHAYITSLADEGAEYMAHAYELFQKAYTQETFDEANAKLAYQYLERATKRVRVIVSMLHGNIPDDVIIQ